VNTPVGHARHRLRDPQIDHHRPRLRHELLRRRSELVDGRRVAAAKEFVAKPGPMMIDLRISKSVPSVPYRRIHYGRDE